MATLSRWLASVALAAGLGAAALAPLPARADDDLVRVIVDVADVIYHSGHPYYRYGNYGYDDRLIVSRDRYGRRVYYREVPRYVNDRYRVGPPYGNAYGHWRKHPAQRTQVKCDRHGRCVTRYYDPRHDERRYRDGYGYYDSRNDRYDRDRDARRWRDRDDD